MSLPIASYKLRVFDRHVRIVPARDADGCVFAGPGIDLRGEAADAILLLARPIFAWLEARDPRPLRTIAIDRDRRRLLMTFDDVPRPRVLRFDDASDPASTTALLELAVPLERRLGVVAAEVLAKRGSEGSTDATVAAMNRALGKVAIVTGAASGIGLATVKMLVREGARVVATDRNVALGEETARASGATFRPLDVRDEEQWIATVDAVVAELGRLDVLVNNAGVGIQKDIESTSLAEWRFVHSVNTEGVFLGCREAIRVMKKSGGGSIVNVSSIAGIVGDGTLAAYCSSKAAVRLLSKSVALHCAQQGYGIRCNSVHPSFIATPMVQSMIDVAPEPERARTRVRLEKASPLGRLGEPDDVAAMILYLASDESRFVTGAEMIVDGGTTAR